MSEDLAKRAKLCLEIATAQNPMGSADQIEDIAVALMHSPTSQLEELHAKLAVDSGVSFGELLNQFVVTDGEFQDSKFEADSKPEREPVTFEDLSPAAQKGLDNFRAYMRNDALEFCRDGDLYVREKGDRGTIIDVYGACAGFMMAAGATISEVAKGESFAHQHKMWIKKVPRPIEPVVREDDEDDGEEKISRRTQYDYKFVG